MILLCRVPPQRLKAQHDYGRLWIQGMFLLFNSTCWKLTFCRQQCEMWFLSPKPFWNFNSWLTRPETFGALQHAAEVKAINTSLDVKALESTVWLWVLFNGLWSDSYQNANTSRDIWKYPWNIFAPSPKDCQAIHAFIGSNWPEPTRKYIQATLKQPKRSLENAWKAAHIEQTIQGEHRAAREIPTHPPHTALRIDTPGKPKDTLPVSYATVVTIVGQIVVLLKCCDQSQHHLACVSHLHWASRIEGASRVATGLTNVGMAWLV